MKGLIFACLLLSTSIGQDGFAPGAAEIPNPEERVKSQSWPPVAEDFSESSKEKMSQVESLVNKRVSFIKKKILLIVGKKKIWLKNKYKVLKGKFLM